MNNTSPQPIPEIDQPEPERKPTTPGASMGVTTTGGKVLLTFTQSLTEIRMTARQARELADMLRRRANELEPPRRRR